LFGTMRLVALRAKFRDSSATRCALGMTPPKELCTFARNGGFYRIWLGVDTSYPRRRKLMLWCEGLKEVAQRLGLWESDGGAVEAS
jgi:hypothetical protein